MPQSGSAPPLRTPPHGVASPLSRSAGIDTAGQILRRARCHRGDSFGRSVLLIVMRGGGPPALRDMRKTVTSGSSVKALIMRSRCSIDMLPFSTTHLTPTCSAAVVLTA